MIQFKHATGFTLIEVLVTIAIMTVGLIGLLGLNAQNVQQTYYALLRTQAVDLGQDMAERMKANKIGLNNNDYSNINGVYVDPGCITVNCTPVQLSQYDAFEWTTRVSEILPTGTGTVICVDSDLLDGDLCTDGSDHLVTINWVENEIGGQVNKSFSFRIGFSS